jgi:outer membrane protein assembly factor BamB
MTRMNRLVGSGILGAILLAGCGGTLRLGRQLTPSETDWLMFGGSSARANVASKEVLPPLALVWEYDLSAGVASGTPILADSVLLIGDLRGELHAVNATTGKRLGWTDLGEAIHGTPALVQSIAYVPLTNTLESLVAYDLSTGKVLWEREYGEIEASLLITHGNLYFGNLSGTFLCISATTGDTRWKYSLPENTSRKGIRSTAVSAPPLVIFGADDGSVTALDAEGGILKWRTETGAPILAPLATDSSLLIAANLRGTVTALSPDSGRILWSFEAHEPVHGHPLLTTELVVTVTAGGTIIALDRTTGHIRWSTQAGGPLSAGAVESGRYLYIGTLNRECLAVRLTDGIVVWKIALGGRVKTSPIVASGTLYLVTDEKTLLAFRSATP